MYPWYFLSLHNFGKRVMRENPRLWATAKSRLPLSDLQIAYKLLKLGSSDLTTEAVREKKICLRLLYAGMSLFLVILFSGLIDAAMYR